MRRVDISGRVKADVSRTPQGGIKVPANLTRTGVFTYTYTDGSTVRELRHPDEVFSPESLASLRDAPVVAGHPAMIRPANWRDYTVGHVSGDARPEGQFVTADVVVQDGNALRGVDEGRLVEVSMGYDCDVVAGAGVYDGEAYDARQMNIRYNHVGLGPDNWGRAGNQVRLKLDGTDVELCYIGGMTDQLHELQARIDALESQLAQRQDGAARYDALQAKFDASAAENAQLKTDLALAKAASTDEALASRVDAKVQLLSVAKPVLGDSYLPSASARDVRIAVISKLEPTFKADGRSDDYVTAYFDSVIARADSATRALGGLERATVDAGTTAPNTVGEAHVKMVKSNQNRFTSSFKGGN